MTELIPRNQSDWLRVERVRCLLIIPPSLEANTIDCLSCCRIRHVICLITSTASSTVLISGLPGSWTLSSIGTSDSRILSKMFEDLSTSSSSSGSPSLESDELVSDSSTIKSSSFPLSFDSSSDSVSSRITGSWLIVGITIPDGPGLGSSELETWSWSSIGAGPSFGTSWRIIASASFPRILISENLNKALSSIVCPVNPLKRW